MVSSKALFIGLAVLVSCFLTASSLKCYKCEGKDKPPASCSANYTCTGALEKQCISQVEKDDDGKVTYKRGCANVGACTTLKGICTAQKLINKMDDCSYDCCDSDNCNDKFPSLDSGVHVTSGLLTIAATLSFALFVM